LHTGCYAAEALLSRGALLFFSPSNRRS
jgi:hypothetical protein